MRRAELRRWSNRGKCDAGHRWTKTKPFEECPICATLVEERYTHGAPLPPSDTGVRRVAGHTAPISGMSESRQKLPVVESRQIRDSARGQPCTLRFVGVCNGDPETTVLAHLPGPVEGYKRTDLACVAYACSACHDALDRRTAHDISALDREWHMRRAQTLTLTHMLDRGLIVVVGHDGERAA